MRYRVIGLTFLYLLARIPALQAKDAKWFEMSSEHFLLFTDINEAKGRRLISDFENRVAALSQAFGKVPARQFPIEIFLFNNEQDFIEALPHAQGRIGPFSSRKTNLPMTLPTMPVTRSATSCSSGTRCGVHSGCRKAQRSM